MVVVVVEDVEATVEADTSRKLKRANRVKSENTSPRTADGPAHDPGDVGVLVRKARRWVQEGAKRVFSVRGKEADLVVPLASDIFDLHALPRYFPVLELGSEAVRVIFTQLDGPRQESRHAKHDQVGVEVAKRASVGRHQLQVLDHGWLGEVLANFHGDGARKSPYYIHNVCDFCVV